MLTLGFAILSLLAFPNGIVVVEARLQDGPVEPALAAELANALSAQRPADAAALLARRLPGLPGADASSEAVIEADRLVERGRGAYFDGNFGRAAADLTRAREMLRHAIESFDEQRKAADALFRAEMYLAFTFRSQGGTHRRQAAEILKDAIRTFPGIEPSVAEYGPENVQFHKQVRKEMDEAPTAQVHVETAREAAGVYLDGRLVGVTPLDLRHVYPGHYRLHVRRGTASSRVHEIEISAGDNDVSIDLTFDQAVRTSTDVGLVYADAHVRQSACRRHAAQLARVLGATGVLVFWRENERIHLTFIDERGNARQTEADRTQAAQAARELRDGRIGVMVKDDSERPRRVWTWITGGVAVGALATGIVLGLSASSDFDTLKSRYPDRIVDAAGAELRDSASTKQTVADVLVDLGAVAAVGAAVLYWYEGGEAAAEMSGPSARRGR